MKKIILGLLFAIVNLTLFGQKISNDKVPAAVASAFKSKFPEVQKVKWEKEKTEYEANYSLNGAEVSSTFDDLGKWLETETEIKVAELPDAVQQSLKRDYSGFKINEASRIESANESKKFEAELEKGGDKFDVVFTPDGKKVSETKIKEKDKKD